MAALAAGQVLTASLLNKKLQRRVGRARRTSNSSSSTSTSYVSVLRIDDIPMWAGLNYTITWKAHVSVATVTDIMVVDLHYTTDGSTPTSASSTLPGSNSEVDFGSTSQYVGVTLMTDYTPATDLTFSAILTMKHLAGTSSGILRADGTSYTTAIYVDMEGEDPGDTGVDL